VRAPWPLRRLLRVQRSDAGEERRQVEEEMRLHLELRVEQLVAEGMERDEAEAEARRRFARRDATLLDLYRTAHERNRRMRLHDRLESWWMDVRYAARGLLRDPLVAAFVVVALALGMGGVVTSFTLLDRLLLRGPPHVEAPDELVRILATRPDETLGSVTAGWIPTGAYEALRETTAGLATVAAYRVSVVAVGRGAGGARMRVGEVRDGYLGLLGVQPLRGRLFTAGEDAATAGDLAVVSERFRRDRMADDADPVGATVVIADVPHTVVGVLPADFTGTELRRVDVWRLADSRDYRSVNWFPVARRADGVTAGMVGSRAQTAHQEAQEASPAWFRPATLHAGSIRLDVDGREPFEATMAGWLAGIAAAILLVALGNVVNLLLGRLARRRGELAVRVALGSGLRRLLRLVALEGILLAVAAAGVALVVVRAGEPFLRRGLLANDAAWRLSLLDGRLLGALLAALLVTCAVVGLFPALRVARNGLAEGLRGSGRGGGQRDARTRAALTILQAAFSVLLLVGGGLFVRSMAQVRAVDLGVDADRVLRVAAELPYPAVVTRATIDAAVAREEEAYRAALEAVRALPGVEGAAVAAGVPLDGGSFATDVYLPGGDSLAALPGASPYVSAVSADYFSTLGTPLLRGRPFTAADTEGSERVLIVNRTMAAALWPGADPLGRCVRVSSADAPCATVVGVAGDVHRVGLRERPTYQFYLPLEQPRFFRGSTLLVRPAPRGGVSHAALRDAMLAADPGILLVEIEPLLAALDEELRPLRLGTLAFGVSGVLALLVAVLGLYSVMAYAVAWRRREIGVRSALGASRAQLSRLVIAQGLSMAGAGVVLGLVLARVGGRWVEPHLFETSAGDPTVLAGAALTLLAVAVLAAWLPARRAARIPPTEALRAE